MGFCIYIYEKNYYNMSLSKDIDTFKEIAANLLIDAHKFKKFCETHPDIVNGSTFLELIICNLKQTVETVIPLIKSVETTPPSMKTLDDIPNNIEQVIEWCNDNRDKDYIYFFKNKHGPSNREINKVKICEMSSLQTLASMIPNLKKYQWVRNSDTLKCTVIYKLSNVEVFLMNFKLPVRRAAWNLGNDIWISAQCLATLHTGNQYLPKYLSKWHIFDTILNKHYTKYPEYAEYHWTLLDKKIKQYSHLGIKTIYFDTDTIVPWVKRLSE